MKTILPFVSLSLSAVHAATSGVSLTTSTYAGGSGFGLINGNREAAQFFNPQSIRKGADGDFYLAEWSNHAIRRVTKEGVVSTFAGGNGKGLLNGEKSAAQFESPYDLAFGSDGSMYVTDQLNQAIRKIAPNGIVSTFAGGNGIGFANGEGNIASFFNPHGIATDPADNVYVADGNNAAIRKITKEGVVSTFAGGNGQGVVDGTIASSKFMICYGIVRSLHGSLFVSESGAIRKISPQGIVSTIAGGNILGYADGSGGLAKFEVTEGIDIDSEGNLYVADSANHKIRKVTPGGVVTTLAGGDQGFVNGDEATTSFSGVVGIVVSPGAIFIADPGNHAIRKISIPGILPESLDTSTTTPATGRATDGPGNGSVQGGTDVTTLVAIILGSLLALVIAGIAIYVIHKKGRDKKESQNSRDYAITTHL